MKFIIIDTNTWSSVFSSSSSDHRDFKNVLKGIISGRLTLAWGGSIYRKELQCCLKYLKLHNELTKGSRAKLFPVDAIDNMTSLIKSIEPDPDFDDAHIIALQVVSKASIICTKDIRAHKFIKRARLYPKRHERPRIYSSFAHSDLLAG